MIVFVAGMPRAGSMWTYNIVRALYKCSNITVIPEKIPKNESALITEALQSRIVDDVAYCIKTHFKLPNPLPTQHGVKIICNLRDVRDACLSYKRFMNVDFKTCINEMNAMMKAADYYIESFQNNLLTVRFEELGNEHLDAIGKISDFLNLQVSNKQKADIWATYKKSSVKKYLDKLSNIKVDKEGKIKGAKYQGKYDAVRNRDGTYRVFDKATSFQTNHITSDKDGEWKTYFNKEEIEQIIDLSREWLQRHDYKV